MRNPAGAGRLQRGFCVRQSSSNSEKERWWPHALVRCAPAIAAVNEVTVRRTRPGISAAQGA